MLEAMKADSGILLSALKVDGGASANNFLMQAQADVSQAPVHRPNCVETTAMGAAYLAGLAVGYWKDKEDVKKNWTIDRIFQPQIAKRNKTKRCSADGKKSSSICTRLGKRRGSVNNFVKRLVNRKAIGI